MSAEPLGLITVECIDCGEPIQILATCGQGLQIPLCKSCERDREVEAIYEEKGGLADA